VGILFWCDSYHGIGIPSSVPVFGTTDVLLTLFTFLAIYAYLRLEDGDGRWWYLGFVRRGARGHDQGCSGRDCTCGHWTFCIAQRKPCGGLLRSRKFWEGFAIALLIVAPWHVAMHLKYGSRVFGRNYLGIHGAIARRRSALGRTTPEVRPFYLSVLQNEFFPWFYLVPFALAIALRGVASKRSAAIQNFDLGSDGRLWSLHHGFATKFSLVRPLRSIPALAILTRLHGGAGLQESEGHRFSPV